MAWTTPRTWTTGQVVTAAQLNTDIRDNLNFLASGTLLDLYQTTAQTGIVTSTNTAVTWDSERIDVLGMHSVATNTSRVTNVTATGMWLSVKAGVVFEANATGVRQMWLRVDNTTDYGQASMSAFSGVENGLTLSHDVFLAASSYLEVFCWQNSGANRALVTTHGGSFLSVSFKSF